MIRQCFPLAAVLWFSAAAAGRAEPGPPVGRQKKLIFYGINVISAHNLHESAAELADEYPELDGVIVNFWPDDCKYRHWGGCNGLFGARAYTRDDFARTIADLQRVPLPERLKENFLYVKTTVNAGPKMMATPEETVNIDWFDPGWAAITRNMALFAQIAREAGFRGLQFDFEEYSTPHNPLWRYFASRVFRQYRADRGLPEMGFEEYAAQARQRGRQMMTAVTAAYPDSINSYPPLFSQLSRFHGFILSSVLLAVGQQNNSFTLYLEFGFYLLILFQKSPQPSHIINGECRLKMGSSYSSESACI